MRARVLLAGASCCVAACLFPDVSGLGTKDSGADAGVPGDASPGDASPDTNAGDAGTTACDPSKPFTAIAPISELDDANDQYKATLSPDELEIWYGFTQTIDGGSTQHIMHASRATRGAAFGTPAVEPNIAPGDVDPAVTDDALGLYYSKFGSVGNWDLFYATRATRNDAFGTGAQLPASVQSASADTAPFVAFDGSLFFASSRLGTNDIWHAEVVDGGLATPAMVPSLSSPANDEGVVITHDGLWVYVTSNRTDLGSPGGFDIFLAHRSTVSDAFGALVNQPELNGTSVDRANWISPDGCRLYFESTRNGGQSDLFLATKVP